MEQLTEQELLQLYSDTIDRCGIFLLKEDDETIAYNIYEEFDIGVHSFLHENSLERLYRAGLISEQKLEKSALLRNKVMEMQESDEWESKNFRSSEKWKVIMLLADEIKITD